MEGWQLMSAFNERQRAEIVGIVKALFANSHCDLWRDERAEVERRARAERVAALLANPATISDLQAHERVEALAELPIERLVELVRALDVDGRRLALATVGPATAEAVRFAFEAPAPAVKLSLGGAGPQRLVRVSVPNGRGGTFAVDHRGEVLSAAAWDELRQRSVDVAAAVERGDLVVTPLDDEAARAYAWQLRCAMHEHKRPTLTAWQVQP
jgi:hypothetical protein